MPKRYEVAKLLAIVRARKTTFHPIGEKSPGVQTGAVERTTLCVRLILHRAAIAPANATSCSARIGICVLPTARRRRRRKRGRCRLPVGSPLVVPNLCGRSRARALLSTKYGKPWSGRTTMEGSRRSNVIFFDGQHERRERLKPDAVSAAHPSRSCNH
jgi:hypothetical protein